MQHQLISNPLVWYLIVGSLFFGMLLFLELGYRWGKAHLASDPDGARVGLGGIEAAVYSLFGLLIAFSFSGAASRFDLRRTMITDEANAIGTAYLRLDYLPESSRPVAKDLFRKYLSGRLEAYRLLPDIAAAEARLAEVDKLQSQIWETVIANCDNKTTPACSIQLPPAVNSMFDIANSRLFLTQMHPPFIIFIMLILLGMVCAFMAGFAMAEGKTRKSAYALLFPLIIAFTVYIILDLEYPRIGFIQVSDLALERALQAMK